MQLIIRSHEGPDAREKRDGLGGMDIGYTIDHNVESGKLITIFSAPDYPQFQVFFSNLIWLTQHTRRLMRIRIFILLLLLWCKATEERYRNKGAYIILQAPDFSDPQFRSFEAVTPRPKVVHEQLVGFWFLLVWMHIVWHSFLLNVQSHPFYDFENVIDSDDEMDKSALDTNEEQATHWRRWSLK